MALLARAPSHRTRRSGVTGRGPVRRLTAYAGLSPAVVLAQFGEDGGYDRDAGVHGIGLAIARVPCVRSCAQMFTAEFERAMMLTVRPMTGGITAVCLCA